MIGKRELLKMVRGEIKQRQRKKISLSRTARKLNIADSQMYLLLHRNPAPFSCDYLMKLLLKLDYQVTISVIPRNTEKIPKAIGSQQ